MTLTNRGIVVAIPSSAPVLRTMRTTCPAHSPHSRIRFAKHSETSVLQLDKGDEDREQ